MLEKHYNQEKSLELRHHEIYRLPMIVGMNICDLVKNRSKPSECLSFISYL